MFEIIIPGRPIPLQRHRMSGKRAFDPQKNEKQQCAWYMKSQFKRLPLKGAITIGFKFYFSPAISLSDKKRTHLIYEQKYHTQKIDLSNLIKFVEDAGNGILWQDDCLITRYLDSEKLWAEKEKTVIYFEELWIPRSAS